MFTRLMGHCGVFCGSLLTTGLIACGQGPAATPPASASHAYTFSEFFALVTSHPDSAASRRASFAHHSFMELIDEVASPLAAPLVIGGETFSTGQAAVKTATSAALALAAKFPTVGAYWDAIGYNHTAALDEATVAATLRLLARPKDRALSLVTVGEVAREALTTAGHAATFAAGAGVLCCIGAASCAVIAVAVPPLLAVGGAYTAVNYVYDQATAPSILVTKAKADAIRAQRAKARLETTANCSEGSREAASTATGLALAQAESLPQEVIHGLILAALEHEGEAPGP